MIIDIETCINMLNAGKIILYPTDTVWGIGCDATNEQAVAAIFELKQRADTKSMLVLVSDIKMLADYTENVPERALNIIKTAQKPTTIIYPRAKNLAKNLINSNGSIGIRITFEAFTQELIQQFGKPIVSTSANISGQTTPAFFAEISEEIKAKVDYIVKYRQTDVEKTAPSAIVLINPDNSISFLRE